MERILMEYLVNSIWQVPLLAAGAWLVLCIVGLGPKVQHWIWVGVLGLIVAMPLLSLHDGTSAKVVTAPISTVGQAGGEIRVENPAVGIDSHAEVSETPAATVDRRATGVRPTARFSDWIERPNWLRIRDMKLSLSVMHLLAGLYLATVLFALFRLVCSWVVARRMVARARPAAISDGQSDLLAQCSKRLGLSAPEVRISSQAWSPVVVGVMRPSLLLPESFAEQMESPGCSAHELEAVWLHELAHMQRRDYLANLVCRVIALPVAYHPATYAVQRRIRQTREMVCDAMAAAKMEPSLGYVRCLVELARGMQQRHGTTAQAYGTGMFDGGVLEERVIQLTRSDVAMSKRMRTLRLAGGFAMLVAVGAVSASFRVTPIMAQEASGHPSGVQPPAVMIATVSNSTTAGMQPEDQSKPTTLIKPVVPVVFAGERAEIEAPAGGTQDAAAKNRSDSPELKQTEDARRQVDNITLPSNLLEAANQIGESRGLDSTPESKSGPNEISHIVHVELGKTYFEGGDSITIDEVRGTSDTLAPGNMYQVKGTYKLVSQDHAELAAFVTTSEPSSRPTPNMRTQLMQVDKGEGHFTLLFYMWEKGDPHISFYPAEGGSSFAGVYFSQASPSSATQ